MHTKVLEKLKELADVPYRQFTQKLLPQNVSFLGVRIPIIRNLAKTIIKQKEAEVYLKTPLTKLKYQDELILYAVLLGQTKLSEEEKISHIKNFIPYINSWAVCDVFCAGLKFIKKHSHKYYDLFLSYTQSQSEYQIRFFYVLALGYFITDELLPKVLKILQKQNYVGFYDKMAVAWFLSVAYVKFPQEIENFLVNTLLDDFVFRKAISKICDSYRVTKEAKIHLRTLASEILKNRKINSDK